MIKNKTNQKRIVTNEDLYSLILDQRIIIDNNKDELKNMILDQNIVIADNKKELYTVINGNKQELKDMIFEQRIVIDDNKDELKDMISNQHNMIVESFDRVFGVIDDVKNELKTEFKKDIGDLRSEMNQRFISTDKRLLKIENDMVHRYEFEPLIKRVRLLEA